MKYLTNTKRRSGRRVLIFLLLICALCALQGVPAQADSLLLPGYNTPPMQEEDEQGNPLPNGFLAAMDGLEVGVGLAVSNSPYKQYSTSWMPLPIISYEGKYAYIRGMTAGVKLINEHFVEVSAFVGYDSTSFDSADSRHSGLRQLKDRHASGVAGLEARFLTPIGLFSATASGDVLGHSNGFTGNAAYIYSLEIGDLELDPSVGLAWSTSKYNDYYYGISENESRKSKLRSYDAGAGIAPFVGITAIYSVNDNIDIFCGGQVKFLESSVKDSPMVGKSETYSVQTGLTYSFF